jgi:hypothetical protein
MRDATKPGDIIGEMTLVEEVDLKDFGYQTHRRGFRCRCACGEIKVVRLTHLKQGKIKSCGCHKARKAQDRWAEIPEGTRCGRLVVVGHAPRRVSLDGRKHRVVKVRCDCGAVKNMDGSAVRSGKNVSCGCYRDENRRIVPLTHGMARTPTYKTWAEMRKRCLPKYKDAKNYFDRGIRVCKRWAKFENFIADMGERPEWAESIDRIDNSQGYTPSNCRWATRITQANNKRSSRIIPYQGVRYTLAELARAFNIPYNRLQARLNAGWTTTDAVSTPKMKNATH